MFTKQAGILERLRNGMNVENIIDTLTAAYHNCAAALFHRAPVTIEVDGAKEHVPRRAGNAPAHQLYAPLNLHNYSAYYDTTNEEYVNGVTLNVSGPVNIQPSDYVTNNSETFEENYSAVLHVWGDVIFEGDQIVEENVTINNSLSVTLNVTISGTLTVTGTIANTTPITATVVTDVQYDSATNKFQKKTQTLTVLAKGAESGWTDVFTAATKDVVVDTSYDTGTGVFAEVKATLTVFEAGSNDGGTTVFTAESC